MSKTDYEKYLVRKPAYKDGAGVTGRQSPVMTYMSNDLVPGCNANLEFSWIYAMPSPNPHMVEHSHEYDMIILYIGGDPRDLNDMGGELIYYVGGQPITFNKNASFFIPKGIKHGPVIWKSFRKPHLEMTLILGPASEAASWVNNKRPASTKLPEKKDNINYEKYFAREPIYLDLEDQQKRKSSMGPVRMFMCNDLISGCNLYLDYPWFFARPEDFIPQHVHDYNEIVVHIGGDPDNPEELGAEVEIVVDNQPLTFDTTTALFIPKGIVHGPLSWKKVSKPHIQMPIIIGSGDLLKAAPAGYKAK
jgi:hypothetical protein